MLSLSDLLFSSFNDEMVGDHTAMALKAPSPDLRRQRLENSANLQTFSERLVLPPRGELIEAFDCAWSKQRTRQANDDLYLTVSQVEVRTETRDAWRAYGAYLGWCGDAACSNLFFTAAARLYRDASLNLFKILKDCSPEELESSLRLLSEADLLGPVLEAVDGHRMVERALFYRGRLVEEGEKQSVLDRLDAFVQAVKTWATELSTRNDPLLLSVVLLFKGAGVAIFNPDPARRWQEEVPDLLKRIQGCFDWLERRSPRWRVTLLEQRFQRALGRLRRELRPIEGVEVPDAFLDLDRQTLLSRTLDCLLGSTGEFDGHGGVVSARDAFLRCCADEADEGDGLILCLLDLAEFSFVEALSPAHRQQLLEVGQEMEDLRRSLSGKAREAYRRSFVPYPMERGDLFSSVAGWEGTPRLRKFLLGMGEAVESGLATELDRLLEEARADQELPADFYTALSNILGKKGYPGLAALSNYHLSIRQIEGGQVGTALGSLGLCFGLLEQANKLSFDSVWYRWTYEIACHAATKMNALGGEHVQGTNMLKEIALLALRDLQRLHGGKA